jgi:hypothetical protein
MKHSTLFPETPEFPTPISCRIIVPGYPDCFSCVDRGGSGKFSPLLSLSAFQARFKKQPPCLLSTKWKNNWFGTKCACLMALGTAPVEVDHD